MDILTPELRAAEKEIDTAYMSNPLVKKPFARSAWRIMAFYEDLALREMTSPRIGSPIEARAFGDYVVNKVQYPLRWLYHSSPRGGDIPTSALEEDYASAAELADIADNYEAFVSAFTFASRGLVQLQIQGSRIVPDGPFYGDPRYDAYDWLVGPDQTLPDVQYPNFIELVSRRVQVSGEHFSYGIGRRFVQRCSRILAPVIESAFDLPSDWEFDRYSLRDFREVSRVLVTFAFIHFSAHIQAARDSCIGAGYSSSLIEYPIDRLRSRLFRYSGVSSGPVAAIVEDLTFGNRGIREPDPALQPIIPLTDEVMGIMPTVLIASNTERNLISLLNRIPEERETYLRLVNHKEAHMRAVAMEKLEGLAIRYFHGSVPSWSDLPDIDLALISDTAKTVIILELKWFIAPAEPWEVAEKSDEISRGIDQLQALSVMYHDTPDSLLNALQVDGSYEIYWIVASQNSIGDQGSQSPDIPVIRFNHLLDEVADGKDLRSVAEWAQSKDFLPIEGEDFEVASRSFEVAGWTLDWFGLVALK